MGCFAFCVDDERDICLSSGEWKGALQYLFFGQFTGQLCNATGDMGYCSACIQKLVDEGTLPGMEIFSCLNDKGKLNS